MKYGFDLDTVCVDFQGPFKKYIETEYGTSIKNEDIVRWYWSDCLDFIQRDSFDELFDRFVNEGHFRHLKPRPEAKLAVRRCQDLGHEVCFITSRHAKLKKQTEESVMEHFGVIAQDVYIANGRKSKYIEQANVDVFIDDSPVHAIEIYCHTKAKVYMLDWPYNQMIKVDDPEKFIRVSSLYDFMIKENLI